MRAAGRRRPHRRSSPRRRPRHRRHRRRRRPRRPNRPSSPRLVLVVVGRVLAGPASAAAAPAATATGAGRLFGGGIADVVGLFGSSSTCSTSSSAAIASAITSAGPASTAVPGRVGATAGRRRDRFGLGATNRTVGMARPRGPAPRASIGSASAGGRSPAGCRRRLPASSAARCLLGRPLRRSCAAHLGRRLRRRLRVQGRTARRHSAESRPARPVATAWRGLAGRRLARARPCGRCLGGRLDGLVRGGQFGADRLGRGRLDRACVEAGIAGRNARGAALRVRLAGAARRSR